MTYRLAPKLYCRKNTCLCPHLGLQKVTNIDTHVMSFNVETRDGSYMTLSANVLNHITGMIQRNPLAEKDLQFLKLIPSSELADSIPGTYESIAIDLLIGSDFFWNIVEGNKVMLYTIRNVPTFTQIWIYYNKMVPRH